MRARLMPSAPAICGAGARGRMRLRACSSEADTGSREERVKKRVELKIRSLPPFQWHGEGLWSFAADAIAGGYSGIRSDALSSPDLLPTSLDKAVANRQNCCCWMGAATSRRQKATDAKTPARPEQAGQAGLAASNG
jgi:hypothetical protein